MLENIPGIGIYNEGSDIAYHKYRIRSRTEISRLIETTGTSLILFELANDLQYTDRFLDLHPHSKALWIFRNYHDVVRDAVRRWGPAQKDIMVGIARGVDRHPGQRAIAEAMAPETLSLVKKFAHENMSPEDGAALLWYTRNLFYFQLKCDEDPRVLLVKYEDLVTRPVQHARWIFDFIACDFKDRYVRDIDASHIGEAPIEGLNPGIRALCDGLMDRLNERNSAAWTGSLPTNAGA